MQRTYLAPGVARPPAFCHAVMAGDFIYVSGTLGTKPDSMDLVEGGTGPETTQTLRNIAVIRQACGASLADLVKVSVFLADMQAFPEMNEAYLAVMGADPPLVSRWGEPRSPLARPSRSMGLHTNQRLRQANGQEVLVTPASNHGMEPPR